MNLTFATTPRIHVASCFSSKINNPRQSSCGDTTKSALNELRNCQREKDAQIANLEREVAELRRFVQDNVAVDGVHSSAGNRKVCASDKFNMFDEMQERSTRAKNIMYNLEENTSAVATERSNYDKMNVVDILHDLEFRIQFRKQVLRNEQSRTMEERMQCLRIQKKFEAQRVADTRKGNNRNDFCYYCKEPVLNVVRLVVRNHNSETDVQRIRLLEPRSKKNKELLATLRKKGCIGFYTLRLLWQHSKKCCENNDTVHKASGRNMLLRNAVTDKKLVSEVFPRMRPDNVSLTPSYMCIEGKIYKNAPRKAVYCC
nr:unnamed protein product [Callosobruchus analis]